MIDDPLDGPALSALEIAYQVGGEEILSPMTFSLNRGKFIAIVGKNGAGKTTLLRCLAGLLPASGGSVHIDGKDLSLYSSEKLSRIRSYLSQDTEIPLGLCVSELLSFSRYPFLFSFHRASSHDREAISEAVELLGLQALLNRKIETLSGGERQRVLIASMFAQECPLMFVDEPAASLDIESASETYRLFAKRAQDKNVLIIAITHNINAALLYADTFLAISEGKLNFIGDPVSFVNNRYFQQVFSSDLEIVSHPSAGIPMILPRKW